MELAMTLPTMVPHGRGEVVAWCAAIDEGPWSSLAVPERITYPSHSMIVHLSAAAALTERVRLWTTIAVLPAHNAVEVAKQMASVDQLCNGRLTLGVGVGGREHDYLAIGANFARRWSRMDEQVATMRRIWAGEPPFPGADPVGPPPVQPAGPPLIAGALGPKAIGRAARWADGVDGAWTLDGDEAAVRSAFDLIEAAWRAAGRADEPHLSTSIWYALGPDAEARLRKYAYDYLRIFGEEAGQYGAQGVVCFTPEALRRAVDNIRAAGAHELFLVPTTADPVELDRTRETLTI
jgi:alkanesulfonate monooxygenase SsuD/methylene tetrahydromethanopterin reductase-like flavin-dependent oxidoreductase (luciferase family)